MQEQQKASDPNKQKASNPNIFRRVLIRIRRKKPLVEKNQGTVKWHMLIEGGVLVQFSKANGATNFSIIGDKAVYAVMQDRADVENALKHMKDRFGQNCTVVEEGTYAKKTLFFIYHPIELPACAELLYKYEEMLSVMLNSKTNRSFLTQSDIRYIAATPLGKVIEDIELL